VILVLVSVHVQFVHEDGTASDTVKTMPASGIISDRSINDDMIDRRLMMMMTT